MIENLYTPDCIRTYTGIYVNVFEPTEDMICIEDIAHSLSQQPRFAGHLSSFYSVAQHCCSCCYIIEDDAHKLPALLHDASEAYLLDMPKPIKNRMPEYKAIEDRLMTVIASKFGFEYPPHNSVKAIDKMMLEEEWKRQMLRMGAPFAFWDMNRAEQNFLTAFKLYKP